MWSGVLQFTVVSSIILCAFIVNRWRKAARFSSETNDGARSLGADAKPDDGSCCPPLLPKHKIFLSHSGKQKWFVEKLCDDLEVRHRFPFFDRRSSSLPKGERFSKLIVEAAEQCEMALVVVSEEFLTSKWPMIELSTFVRALGGSNPGLKILPLFFGMSVSDLGDPSRLGAWSKEWEKWERKDPRMKSADLEKALKVICSFNGIVFDGDMNNVWGYEKFVVKEICNAVRADVKWDDLHVQGRSSICEGTRDKIKEMEPREDGIRVFGYYGVGGIGKTTMCKTLCDELSNEFLGKVCHVELGGTRSVEQMLKEVLEKLTHTSEAVLERLNEGECRSILKNCSSWKERTFLEVDNVWDDNKSMVEAKMFTEDPAFHEGSVVMVTSRCQRTLTRIGIKESHCFEVPELSQVDARKLFLHHVVGGKQFANEEDNVVIDKCIARCWFQKSEIGGFHYLPLALKVLGIHLGWVGRSPKAWLKGLQEVRDFNRFDGDNPVFSIIRLNYDRLSAQLQALFMDLVVFGESWRWGHSDDYLILSYFGWLGLIHGLQLQGIENQLQELKERGLVEDVDMEGENVSMHDLYKEFAWMEAKGKLNNSVGFNKRKWVYHEGLYPSDLERSPSGRCWEELIRMHVEFDSDPNALFNLPGIQWRYFANLVVLTLARNYDEDRVRARGVLNLEGLRCLRSLTLSDLGGIEGVDGLKDLMNLTYFSGVWNGVWNSSQVWLGQLPASIKGLELQCVDASLKSDMFDHCTNLLDLSLRNVRANNRIDLRRCTYLRRVFLERISGLETFIISCEGSQSCLQELLIINCYSLSCVSGLGDLVSLRRLHLCSIDIEWEELRDLQIHTCLEDLDIDSSHVDDNEDESNSDELIDTCKYSVMKTLDLDLGSAGNLLEIYCSRLEASKFPNLNALKHLRRLCLTYCKKLTHLEGMEGLMALEDVDLSGCSSLSQLRGFERLTTLRTVSLSGCESLSRLPDLSNSTKLEILSLSRSAIVFHKEDMDMLATLSMLDMVHIGSYWWHARCRRLFLCEAFRYQATCLCGYKKKALGYNFTAEDEVKEEGVQAGGLPIQLQHYDFCDRCGRSSQFEPGWKKQHQCPVVECSI